jgi:hypothetical protein
MASPKKEVKVGIYWEVLADQRICFQEERLESFSKVNLVNYREIEIDYFDHL